MKRSEFLGSLLFAGLSLQAEVPRITVANFDYSTVRSSVLACFGSEVDLGRGMADMVEARLSASGKFRVYERRRLGTVLDEQDNSNSNRFDSKTAIRIGGLAGTDIVVLGSITRFGRDDGRKGVNVGGFLSRWIPAGDVHIGSSAGKAVVGMTLKMVNTRTGEIIGQAEAIGQSQRNSSSLTGLVSLGGRTVSGGTQIQAENFAETILGEAASNAIQQLVEQLLVKSTRNSIGLLISSTVGKVAKVVDDKLYVAIGATSGWREGQVLPVKRVVEIIYDPEDKAKILDQVTETVGEARVVEVRENITILTFTGAAKIQTGYLVGGHS